MIIILCLSIGMVGCDKWLTVQPKTMVTDKEMFSTAQGYQDALIGCYQLMKPLYNYNGPMVITTIESLACVWETTKNSVEEKLGLQDYNDSRVDTKMEFIFQNMYKVIANVSELIKALENDESEVLTEVLYSQYMGEALGLRAFLHLELMRLWGPMPSNVKLNKRYLPFVEGIQVQAYEYIAYQAYMSKIEKDLKRAELLLKKDPLNIWVPKSDFMNYYSILAISARYHFWMGNKEEAIDYGNRLLEVDTLKYFPLQEVAGGSEGVGPFLGEAIWKFHYFSKENISTIEYNFEDYVINELFEGNASDIRLSHWRKKAFDGEKQARMILNKYDKYIMNDETEVGGFVPIIRISEIYLMLIELESIDRANELYYDYSKARRISPKTFNTKGEILKQLMLEYRREFVGEGQLFYAYKRWGTSNIPRSKRKNGESSYVPPIPQKEFNY